MAEAELENQKNDIKIIEAIQSILESSLTHALDNCIAKNDNFNPQVILPIVLSRFVYRELLIMSRVTGLDIDKMKKVFIKLFENLSEFNVDEVILEE